jgi:hypothetical protein
MLSVKEAIQYPSYSDLMDNAEAGLVRRSITRYLVPKNYESSIRRHRLIGTPIFRKVVLGTLGRNIPVGSGGNYRLNSRLGRLDSANNYAFKSSVFNEAIHTGLAVPQLIDAVPDFVNGSVDFSGRNVALAINLACVALQRYSRARMVGFMDRSLSRGATFEDGYRSWTGIDNRAINNFEAQTVMESAGESEVGITSSTDNVWTEASPQALDYDTPPVQQ